MIITFYNKKGGVGKTNLSYCVAKRLNSYLISNDDSLIEVAYKGKAMIEDKILDDIKNLSSQGVDVVVDLGGFITEETEEILSISDKVIIPCIADMNSMKRTISTYEESIKNNPNTYVIANIIENDKDLKMIKEVLDMEIHLKIGESRVFHNALKDCLSFDELVNNSGLNKHIYRNVIKDFNKLVELVEKK